jgi:hypothetical protein
MLQANNSSDIAAVTILAPVSYAIEDVPRVTGFSRTRIFEAIRAGALTARKDGRSTIIEASEVQRWIRSLPTRGRQPAATAA